MIKTRYQNLFFAALALHMYSSGIHSVRAQEKPSTVYAEKGYLTFDQKPLGSLDKPLVLRTYVPTGGVSHEAVLPNHSTGSTSPKYSAGSGKESSKEYQPIDGIPAAIAVNLGKTLSYVWDTTECRLLYAWTDGFLDMKNYWGERESGQRRRFEYVPKLYGFVFYKAQGVHPLRINEKSIAEIGSPKYVGYSLGKHRLPSYDFKSGKHSISVKVSPGPSTQTLRLDFTSTSNESLDFKSPNTQVKKIEKQPGRLSIEIRPNAGERLSSDEPKVVIKNPTLEIGEKLYTTLGCIACHSLDGGKNHGPTLKGVYGAKREFLSAQPLTVDEAYLRESIENPMAKTAKGYLTGMMPPYQLQEAEYESLIMFIKSVR
jgi:cytochrome c2